MVNIREKIIESIEVKTALLEDQTLLDNIQKISDVIVSALNDGKKVLFCGNGGSAADAQHLAAELSGRFYYDRPPLYSEALHVNTSYMTAVGNDYGYDETYARMVRACGRKGDVLVGISTSGNSTNIIKAFEAANELGMITVAMTGENGGKMKALSQFLLNVPSSDTPRIQESHILLGHIMCQLIESNLFPKP